ncbi:MAG: HAMP domain-containing histidine kinase [Anaerolineae bacterium]|nr:HAMP domain-containing histidine kinase [Anaerolineae bacterium]
MLPKSIRWRLPLTYAAIALLTALTLGVVLLTTLRGFYGAREREYLYGNAGSISQAAANMLSSHLSKAAVRARLESFAFLSQTRVQLLDSQRNVLVDSGEPKNTNALAFSFVSPNGVQFGVDNPSLEYLWSLSRGVEDDAAMMSNLTDELFFMSVVPTLYGFGLSPEVRSPDRVSDQFVEVPIVNEWQHVVGYVKLSEGPAYGAEIVDGVARDLALASLFAIVLAAVAGFFISRRMSAPLLALSAVAERMAAGDLAARAPQSGGDEFGLLARTFNDMAAKIEETVLVLRRFVADAAHEIHTPLTALRTSLELAATSPSDNRAFIQRAHDQVRRLQGLTDSLLQLSRIESNTVEVARESINVAALVQETSEVYASQAEQAGLSFQLELPPTPVIVDIQPAAFRSALSNLIGNAIKFTPENGSIRLSVRQRGAYAEVEVQDTGIGIPPEDLPYIFNRFHRGRNATAYAGSGIGLAIVKAVIERQQGQVQVQSNSNGTQFLLRLPTI